MNHKEKVRYAQIVTEKILSGSSLTDIETFLTEEIKYERPILEVLTKAKRDATDQIGDQIQTMILANENASTPSWGDYERIDSTILHEIIETTKKVLVKERNQQIETLVQEGKLSSTEIIEEVGTSSFYSEGQMRKFIEEVTAKTDSARNDLSWGYKGRVGQKALLGRFVILLLTCSAIFRLALYFRSSSAGLILIFVCGAPVVIYFSML